MTWILASLAFSWYTSHFGNYNKTYGSLGAAIGFMTWIWISTMVVLVGAKINAELENQTTVDATVSIGYQEKASGIKSARPEYL